ncbi:hypothetical protein C8R43DRAFT_994173 [Mycena crocata]|nr:hypothetical protein C8R43DRAFT_994173 [Mycena crocata]
MGNHSRLWSVREKCAFVSLPLPPTTIARSFLPSLPPPKIFSSGSGIRASSRDLWSSPADSSVYLSSPVAAASDMIARTKIRRPQVGPSQVTSIQTLPTLYDDYQGRLAPIRRLPAEVLVEVFSICRQFELEAREYALQYFSTVHKMHKYLARSSLLKLARVCVWWHRIVMGTPIFWKSIDLTRDMAGSIRFDYALGLIERGLQRSGKSVIDVAVYGQPASELVALHSERWRTAKLQFLSLDLPRLSVVRGRLSLLETLELTSYSYSRSAPVDFFATAPNLRSLTISASLVFKVAVPPLSQLRFLALTKVYSRQIAPCVSSVAQLSPLARFRLQVILADWCIAPKRAHALEIRPVVSHIVGLTMDITEAFKRLHCFYVHGAIFASLTLPNLRELSMKLGDYPNYSLPWPHAPFLRLSARSAFDEHLTSLELYHTLISVTQLLEVLDTLPSLERLAIGDHVNTRGVPLQLITGTLLERLTLRGDAPCLVPRLHYFRCRSLLRCSSRVYSRFLQSRAEIGSGRPFEHALRWMDGWRRDLDPAILAEIQELRLQEKLVFSFAQTRKPVSTDSAEPPWFLGLDPKDCLASFSRED